MFKRKQDRGKLLSEEPIGTLLVDFSQIAMSSVLETFNSKYTNEMSKELIYSVVYNTLRANIKKFKSNYDEIVIAMDSSCGYWRKEIAPYYKCNRDENRKQSKLDFDLIFEVINNIKNDLHEYFPYKVIDIPKIEADDAIGVITNLIKSTTKIMILSSDGDFTQLHTHPNVKQYSLKLKKLIKPKYGSPRKDLLMKIIKGDKKDAISSIKSPSNHWEIPPIDRPRQSSFSATVLSEYMIDPESRCTKGEWERFKENEKLLDLTLIPEIYSDMIKDQYRKPCKVDPNGLLNYFSSKGLIRMCENVNDFF